MKRPIKVGILVSYDYECIYNSLPLVYERADKIVLAADKDGKTWSGNRIEIPATFWQWVKEFDVQHKIEIYKDTFYVEGLTPMQCETRERNMLAQYMGKGGWHVQVDADEYFADFGHFVDFLSYLDKKRKRVNLVKMQWLILYKKTANGYLFIKNSDIPPSVATTTPQYVVARNVACIKSTAYYNQRVVHESLARTEDALWTKLSNWGHTNDFDIKAYFEYWKGINEKNYNYVVDFHPFISKKRGGYSLWETLDYVEAQNIKELMQKIKGSDLLKAKTSLLWLNCKFIRILLLCNPFRIPPIFEKIKQKYFKK